MHKLCGLITGILIIVFAIWQTAYSKWILVILGVLLLLHPFISKGSCPSEGMEKPLADTKKAVPTKPLKKKK